MKFNIKDKKITLSIPYDLILIDYIKSFSIFKWNKEDKVWEADVRKVRRVSEEFVLFLKSYGFKCSPEDKETLKLYLEVESSNTRLSTSALVEHISLLDAPLNNGWTLMSHQKQAAAFAIKNRKYILADLMGTGKTVSILSAVNIWKKVYEIKSVVICPASLKFNWKEEAKDKFGIDVEAYSYGKIPEEQDSNFILIADEAHYLQNLKSQRTQKFLNLAKNKYCQAVYLLTGTPMKNGRPINLFPLLKAVNHPLSTDKYFYEKRYCDAKATYFSKWDTSGFSNLQELGEKTKDIILRRTKEECLDLPEKTVNLYPIDPTKAQNDTFKAKLKELNDNFQKKLDEGTVNLVAKDIVQLGYVRQAASAAKIETACEFIDYLLDEGQQVVVFTVYIDTANKISEKYKVPSFTGNLSLEKRHEAVQDFQSGKNKVFVGTIKAGGVGLTLTAASTLIMLDREWTPGDNEQAHDRIHRTGQKNKCSIYWLQFGEYDKVVDDILMAKEKRIAEFLNEDVSAKNISVEKIASKLVRKFFI